MSMPVKGKHILDIAPGEGNPRNSEGAFLTLSDGRILFCYSAFYGESCEDHAKSGISKIVSADGGKTWSEPEPVAHYSDYNAVNIMSVSLMRMQNGDVGIFYLIRQTFNDMRLVLRRSSDEGETWSEPVYCMNRKSYFVVNNDRVIRLRSGRILIPAAEHIPWTENLQRNFFHARAVATFFYSDDDGRSFYEMPESVSLNGIRSPVGLQEPGVIELENGVLRAWARTELGSQWDFYSVNGGETWTSPAPTEFTSPVSPLSMKYLPDGRLFAVWNPIPNFVTRTYPEGTHGRHPLVYAVKKANEKHFSSAKMLETDEKCGYCYTAIHCTEEGILLAYCAGDGVNDKGLLNRLRITLLPYEEL